MKRIINILLTILFAFVYYYFAMPAINVHSVSFYLFIILIIICFTVLNNLLSVIESLKKGKTKPVQVHTLVGKHFVIGYKEGLEIDHIDTNPINNKSNNLRWVDRSANMLNPKTHAKIIKHHIEVQRRPVIGINIKNGFILEFDYVRQAKAAGFKGIGENIHGRAKQCKGYVWRYLNDVQI